MESGHLIRDVLSLFIAVIGFLMVFVLRRYQLQTANPSPKATDTGNLPIVRETIVESIKDGIIVLDALMHIVDVNPAAERLIGIDKSEMLGKSVEQIFATQPSLQKLYKDLIKQLQPEAQPDTLGVSETQIDMHITRLRGQYGDHMGYLIVLQDMADRKQVQLLAERRLEELLRLREIDERLSSTLDIHDVLSVALAAAMEATNADSGFISFIEGEAQRLMKVAGGYSTHLVGRLFPTNVGIVGRALRTQQAEYIEDVRSDPDYYADLPETCAQMVIPLRAQEKIIGVINLETAQKHNFTYQGFEFIHTLARRIAMAAENARLYSVSQKQLSELQTLYDQVSALEQEKTTMIRLASHDLRDPIGTIIGYLDLLRIDKDQLSDEHQLYVTMMRELAEKSEKIIRNILLTDKARTEIADDVPLDVRDLVMRVVDEYKIQIAEKDLSLEVALPIDQAIVLGNNAQMHEAIANLLTNAIKYTPEKGMVDVKLEKVDDKVVFEVTDNGYGIPQDLQKRLFEPFYRAASMETRSISGTGLGLHLVKNIVERHNGTVHYKSTYGEGSTFGFELPLAEVNIHLT